MDSGYEVMELNFDESSEIKLFLDKDRLSDTLDGLLLSEDLDIIKKTLRDIYQDISENPEENFWLADPVYHNNGRCFKVELESFLEGLNQIIETFSLERTKYYIKRLKKSITNVKLGKINDINLNRWKEYKSVYTDSLWIEKKRDRTGKHMASYWGNFIPQIPQQMMLRFTRQGDYVLDTFSGSGTTLIECRKMGRNGIGIELSSSVAQMSRMVIEEQENPFNTTTEVIEGNSVSIDYKKILKERNIKKVQLVIMHPPYHDIIKFSTDEEDLSNSPDVEDFLAKMEKITKETAQILENGRYMCLVIGDKYTAGEWIPLGFLLMQRILDTGFYKLKSIVVKNFQETKGKRNQKELWRYRAMVGGFYVFKHEYVFLFQKE